MTPILESSYRSCEQQARFSGSNFVLAFRTLEREMHREMCTLYAFMRHTDDLGDLTEIPLPERKQRLLQWRNDLTANFHGSATSHPILPAVVDVAHKRGIPLSHLLEVIDGVEGDLSPRSFPSFAELDRYCYQVAGVVGLCCLKIWGYHGREPVQAALACGTAFQLTNILRDLKEDALQGRIYLPFNELAEFCYSPEELKLGINNSAFQSLMKFQVERAWNYYRQASSLQDSLSPPGRRIFRAFFDLYSTLLQEIERASFDVLTRRIRLTRWKKVSVALRCLLRIDSSGRILKRIETGPDRSRSGDLLSAPGSRNGN